MLMLGFLDSNETVLPHFEAGVGIMWVSESEGRLLTEHAADGIRGLH
jgi:hypothetical protein